MNEIAISTVGVVVPACNEEELLPPCLDALERAMAAVPVPSWAVVVLDDCRDGSAAVLAGRPHFLSVELRARNVGRARAAGFETLLRLTAATPPAQLWLATTDADSTVPADWLTVQLEYARQGFEVVLGTVQVGDWSVRPAAVATRFSARYKGGDGHPHMHGANMGMTASAYLGAGGMPPMALSEDRRLARNLAGRRVFSSGRIPVSTSARLTARAKGGFAGYLDSL